MMLKFNENDRPSFCELLKMIPTGRCNDNKE